MMAALAVMKSKLVVGLFGAGAVVVALVVQRQEARRLEVEAAALRARMLDSEVARFRKELHS